MNFAFLLFYEKHDRFFGSQTKWLQINGITQLYSHPRRPRGSQSGREKGRDESFQVRAKKPLGTDSRRAIFPKIQADAGS